MSRILTIPLAIAIAILGWLLLPGSLLDRTLFKLTIHTFTNPPLFTTGSGTIQDPHTLRTYKSKPTITTAQLPTIISLQDDPQGFFQTSPPSPIDIAVILKNLARLNQHSIALATPLAWQETDIISLTALELQLDSFPALITSAPLTRSPTTSPIPPAFRRASLPLNQVSGPHHLLPIVNRIPIPDIVLGKKNTLAAFTTLETQPQSPQPYLLARWDDRIVLSLHLLALLQHHQIPLSSIQIHPGKHIQLNKTGPYIPIDHNGRLRFTPPKITTNPTIPATTLINAPHTLFPPETIHPVILRNDRSDNETLAWSAQLTGTLSTLSQTEQYTTTRTFKRLPTPVELTLLTTIAIIIATLLPLSKTITLIAAPTIIILTHLAITPGNHWLPTIPAILTLSIAAIPTPQKRPIPTTPTTPTQPAPSSTPPPEKPKPTPKPKTPTKKTAKKIAKKTATKTTKKTARKTAKKAPPQK